MRLCLCILLTACVLAGCKRGEASKPHVARSTSAPAGGGLVRGVVKFDAPRPAPKSTACACEGTPRQIPDESLVVGDDGRLANVIVYLKDAPTSDATSATPALLDQKGCQYIPHALAVQTGQKLRISNSDAEAHNVHIPAVENRAQNFSEPVKGDSRDITFTEPEFIRIRCDVHPWMSAFLGVFDHPYYAVTGLDGSFSITNVPPGTYTLVARHERLGEREQKVTIENGRPVDVKFSYKPPSP